MKRSRRMIGYGLVAASSLLFLLSAAGFERSRYADDEFYLENWKYAVGLGLRSDNAYIWEATVQVPVPAEHHMPWYFTHEVHPPRQGGSHPPAMKHVTFLGLTYQFGTGQETDGYSYYHRDVFVPWWMLLTASPVPALLAIFIWRRRGNLNEKRCAVCGYDLRATPEKCPECGTLSGNK